MPRGNKTVPDGEKRQYTAEETRSYKKRRDNDFCYLCNSKDHKAAFHRKGGELKAINEHDMESEKSESDSDPEMPELVETDSQILEKRELQFQSDSSTSASLTEGLTEGWTHKPVNYYSRPKPAEHVPTLNYGRADLLSRGSHLDQIERAYPIAGPVDLHKARREERKQRICEPCKVNTHTKSDHPTTVSESIPLEIDLPEAPTIELSMQYVGAMGSPAQSRKISPMPKITQFRPKTTIRDVTGLTNPDDEDFEDFWKEGYQPPFLRNAWSSNVTHGIQSDEDSYSPMPPPEEIPDPIDEDPNVIYDGVSLSDPDLMEFSNDDETHRYDSEPEELNILDPAILPELSKEDFRLTLQDFVRAVQNDEDIDILFSCSESGDEERSVDSDLATMENKTKKKYAPSDLSDRMPLQEAIVCPITVIGQPGFEAYVDSGASSSACAPHVPRIFKSRIFHYKVPKALALGTKGSRAMVNSYTYLPIQFAGVSKIMRFDILNIFKDLFIARDFLHLRECVLTMGPDSIVARNLEGTYRGLKQHGSARPLHSSARAVKFNSRNELNMIEEERKTLRAKALGKHIYQLHPREIEKLTHPPIFQPRNSTGLEDNVNYVPSPEEIGELHTWILEEFSDVFVGDDDDLPMTPRRDVEHEIPYIDESDPPRPRRTYKIPDRFLPACRDLLKKHVDAGIWVPTTTRNADPMMPIVKEDGVSFRPTINLHNRNANTVKLTMPIQDPDAIRNEIAATKFHLELDVKGAFQQNLIMKKDQYKAAFTAPDGSGTYYSMSSQQGDTNSAVTLARATEMIFFGLIGRMMLACADNIYGFANT